MSDKIFLRASKAKLRFNTAAGMLSAEDLWDLPLISKNSVSLDGVYKNINRELKADDEESLVATPTPESTVARLQRDIVKAVYDVRMADKEAAEGRAAKAERKRKLLELKANKVGEADAEMSEEDIDKELAELG